LQAQAEHRVAGGLPGEEVQEVPLRHEGDEAAVCRQVPEVGDRERRVPDLGGQLRRLLVRQPQERLEQAELVDHLERGGVDRVAAEVAQEVGVLLEDQDLDAGPGQQEAEHHPGRPAAHDAAAHQGDLARGHGVSPDRPRVGPSTPLGQIQELPIPGPCR
jgi:hypothetical protein